MIWVGRPGIYGPGIQTIGAPAFARRRGAGVAFAYDNIPNLAAVYSMRRTLSSYSGPLIRLRRDSDDDELDIGADGEHLDTATAADFLNGADGFITAWYDQSGDEHDATQATASAQPLYVASGQNGRPVARFDGVDDRLNLSGAGLDIFRNAPFIGAMAVARQDGNDGNAYIFAAATTVSSRARFVMGVNEDRVMWTLARIGESSSQSLTSAPDIYEQGEMWIQTAALDFFNADAFLYKNGAEIASTDDFFSGGTVDDTSSLAMRIGQWAGGASQNWPGDIAEIIIANAAWSTGDRQAAEAAAASYWGITLS